ncbi:MAG: hypothetical protein GYA36_03670 [Veillonellaceae bacterium]|nr:hypothetical protein [Veillonellaceae bacterium]
MAENIARMAAKAQKWGVKLRPHTKTHRVPALAKLQIAAGASGITVAKVGEAEVMADNGLEDIFIANEIFGKTKSNRLLAVHRKVLVAVGVDNQEQIESLAKTFNQEKRPLDLMIEIETGEDRTGVLTAAEALSLAQKIHQTPGLRLRGIFTHEGHTYGAQSKEECVKLFGKSQEDVLAVANYLREHDIEVNEVSVGATPSLMHGEPLPGITEIRPGTYIFMDAAQGNSINDYHQCALSVLATVVSMPTAERVVIDAGGKALTSFTRAPGSICETPGYGIVRGFDNLRLAKLYDEHGVINNAEANAKLKIGDKVSIIPNHVCPCVNLYDKLYLVEHDNVIEELAILGRGKSQ